MFYKNTAVRLITINTDDGKNSTSVSIAPNEVGEVKGNLGNAQSFVDYLVESGQLVEVAAPKEEKKTEAKEDKK